jgi:hypothetical protein
MGTTVINPFASAPELGFGQADFVTAFRKLPNLFNRVSGMFVERPIRTTVALVEQSNGTLNIVASRERGAPADKVTADKRQLVAFKVPHLPIDDVILPDEIQDVRIFGDIGMQTNVAVTNEKQAKMRAILDQTREYLSCGALKGIVLDADGSTICDLYDAFGITAAANPGDVGKYLTLAFDLDDEDTDVVTKCLNAKRHIEANLRGEVATGIRCLCSSGFYDALTTHPKVEKAFAAYMALNQSLGQDYRKGFQFGGIVFEEYVGSWTDRSGTARPGIAANEGHIFPEGTNNTFRTIVAPGNFTDAVNQLGQPYYAKIEPKKFAQGWDLWAESNILPICTRPEVLVKVTLT